MKHTTIIFSLLILIACNNEQNIKKTDLKPIIQEENVLELNNNKQWKVLPDMKNYLQYMKEDVGKFEGKTIEDYQELSTDFLINEDLLTANCTIKGEVHYQLHLWLVSYFG